MKVIVGMKIITKIENIPKTMKTIIKTVTTMKATITKIATLEMGIGHLV
ncbi:MAG: hypothetical protein PWP15_519 [Methanothermococcus sp.]|jgi:hypothetical protein|nr:hypothetical protein [Methanothermococcus thermolithotrophicus]MDK2790012.1 hypothetical protein [Methanothermococcus sp.]MDK2986915.1 hypothetical protein [Methanothermococcus sp.]